MVAAELHRKAAGSKRAATDVCADRALALAHDFNNVLSMITMPFEVLRLEPGGPDRQQLHDLLAQGLVRAEEISQRLRDLAFELSGQTPAKSSR